RAGHRSAAASKPRFWDATSAYLSLVAWDLPPMTIGTEPAFSFRTPFRFRGHGADPRGGRISPIRSTEGAGRGWRQTHDQARRRSGYPGRGGGGRVHRRIKDGGCHSSEGPASALRGRPTPRCRPD